VDHVILIDVTVAVLVVAVIAIMSCCYTGSSSSANILDVYLLQRKRLVTEQCRRRKSGIVRERRLSFGDGIPRASVHFAEEPPLTAPLPSSGCYKTQDGITTEQVILH
jgi:hypothetical protein